MLFDIYDKNAEMICKTEEKKLKQRRYWLSRPTTLDFDTKWKYPDTSGDVPSRGGGGQLGQRLQVRRESARPRLRGRACGPSRHFSVVWMMKYRWTIQRSGSVCVHVLHRGLELNCTTFLCCLNGHIKMINTEIPVWITQIIWRGAQASYACTWSIGFSMWV